MTYQELMENARAVSGPNCKACPVCNGKACGSLIPGPGAKGTGDVAVRNYDAWQKIRVNMDTITDGAEPDTSFDLFGRTMKYPVFSGPVGGIRMHYGEVMDDAEYNRLLVAACADAGIAAFTGDGPNGAVMETACAAIAEKDGIGIPTVKPWDTETLKKKFAMVEASRSLAVAMDIDAAAFPFMKGLTPPAGFRTTKQLAEVIQMAGKPFIAKGIMTVEGAKKAEAAGAAGIVVSNHGGRSLDQCPATAEVLYEIAQAVSGRMKIFVDGGIRSGIDIFKALCLGADAVIIARPYVLSVFGGGAEGVQLYTEKLGAELADVMKLCGAKSLSDLSEKYLYRPSNPFIA